MVRLEDGGGIGDGGERLLEGMGFAQGQIIQKCLDALVCMVSGY